MATAAPPRTSGLPAAQPVLPDDILEDIFLRLDAVDDLARAAAACTSFRRVVRARRFVRQFRSLHPALVLGFLNFERPVGLHPSLPQHRSAAPAALHFLPAQPPHPAAPVARALAQTADFTFSFLPDHGRWRACDARDGRFLLARCTCMCTGFVVCDPVHRRYVQVPPIPDDLACSVEYGFLQEFEPFLDAISEKEEDLAFRVICNVLSEEKVVTFVYSSVTGKWRGIAPFSYLSYGQIRSPRWLVRHFARGCFYWAHDSWNNLLMLDTREMKFSVIGLPPNSNGCQRAILDVGEGKLGLLTVVNHSVYLHCKTWCHSGVGAEEWQLDKIIPLPDCYMYNIIDAAEGYLLLQGIVRSLLQMPISQYFTLNLKTLLIERLSSSNQHIGRAHMYARFPPPLSLPSI
ncbi:hypothetical protein ACP70R_032506 [Stipagrostis hirtigluma subsp. patula]